jgi:uncharacterized protein YecT (DUF1311 family)
MKRMLLFGITIMFSLFTIAQTQYELNMDAKKKADIADKELNQTYNKVLNEYKTDTSFIKNLKKAQRLWIQLRDAEMQVKFPERETRNYGSVLPMCWSLYYEELTRERLKILKEWLNGTEEGDVCSGTVKTK